MFKSFNARTDMHKVGPLLLEASSIPLFSRMKAHCQRLYDLSTGQAPTQSPSNGKRVSKPAAALYPESVVSLPAPSLQAGASDFNSTEEERPDYSAHQAGLRAALAPSPSSLNLWPPALPFEPKDPLAPPRADGASQPSQPSGSQESDSSYRLEGHGAAVDLATDKSL